MEVVSQLTKDRIESEDELSWTYLRELTRSGKAVSLRLCIETGDTLFEVDTVDGKKLLRRREFVRWYPLGKESVVDASDTSR